MLFIFIIDNIGLAASVSVWEFLSFLCPIKHVKQNRKY